MPITSSNFVLFTMWHALFLDFHLAIHGYALLQLKFYAIFFRLTVVINQKVMNELLEKIRLQKRIPVDEDHLRWTPLVQAGNKDTTFEEHELSSDENESQRNNSINHHSKVQNSEEEDTGLKMRKRKKNSKKMPLKIDSEEDTEDEKV